MVKTTMIKGIKKYSKPVTKSPEPEFFDEKGNFIDPSQKMQLQAEQPPAPATELQNGYINDAVLASVDKLTVDEIKMIETMGAFRNSEGIWCASTASDQCEEIQRTVNKIIAGHGLAVPAPADVPVATAIAYGQKTPIVVHADDVPVLDATVNPVLADTVKKKRRPKKVGVEIKSRILHLSLKPGFYSKIEEWASSKDISINMLVTSALEKAMKNHEKEITKRTK